MIRISKHGAKQRVSKLDQLITEGWAHSIDEAVDVTAYRRADRRLFKELGVLRRSHRAGAKP